MAICRSCQSYYKKNQWNQSDECSDCAYTTDVPLFDEEDSLVILDDWVVLEVLSVIEELRELWLLLELSFVV